MKATTSASARCCATCCQENRTMSGIVPLRQKERGTRKHKRRNIEQERQSSLLSCFLFSCFHVPLPSVSSASSAVNDRSRYMLNRRGRGERGESAEKMIPAESTMQ